MNGRPWALALILLAAGLAGCIGTDEDLETTEQAGPDACCQVDPPSGPDASLEAPTWSVGDWWSWTSDQADEYTYVVTGQERDHWVVDTDSEQIAFFDAQTDVSFLGPVRKGDLAGSQNGSWIKYFDWPLEEGKTWTTTWDGERRTITVDTIQDGVATLTATQNGRLAVTYEYDSATEGFGEVTFHGEDGSADFKTTPSGSGSNWTGQAVRWSLDTVVDEHGAFAPTPASWGGQFTVPEDTTDIWASIHIDCEQAGAWRLGFGYDDQGATWIQVCASSFQNTGPVVEEPAPGEWDYAFTGEAAQSGTYDVTLTLRTLETIQVG